MAEDSGLDEVECKIRMPRDQYQCGAGSMRFCFYWRLTRQLRGIYRPQVSACSALPINKQCNVME